MPYLCDRVVTPAKFAKETFWAVASKGAAFFFYYAIVYYLTRTMTVDVWGDWSAFLALLNIIMLVSDQGINTATKRYIAEARDKNNVGAVVGATLTLRIIASLLYTFAVAFLIHPLLLLLRQPEHVALMQRSLVLVAFYGVMEYFKSLFEALHRLRFTFVVNAVEHGCKFLLVIALFHGGTDFKSVIAAFTAAVVIAVAAGAVITERAIPRLLNSSLSPALMREVYLYSVPVFLISAGGFVSLEIDTLMLRHLRTTFETGIYSAAKNIVMLLPHLSLAFSMGIIPGISVFDADTVLQKRRLYYQVLGGIIGIYLLIGLAVGAFALWGIRLFFPPAYAAASVPLFALIPFTLFNAVTIYSGNLMVYCGLAWQRSINVAVTLILNVLLNWLLIPVWGPTGAATASSIAYLPYCVLNLRAAHNAFKVALQ